MASIRPIFTNEILGAVSGDYEPRYDKDYFNQTGKLRLLNPIITNGTLHSADTMNNMFDFDNTESMRGNAVSTHFNLDGSISVEVRPTGSDTVTARRTIGFGNNMTVRTIVYDDTGTVVLRDTTNSIKLGETISMNIQ